MGKGEIAYHEQFLFFPQCFQTRKNQGLFGKGVVEKAENIVWKRKKILFTILHNVFKSHVLVDFS